MNRDELIIKIKSIAKQTLANRQKADIAAVEYDELTKFPELKKVIVDLLTSDFDYFLASSALCAAYFVKLYCETRNISTELIRLSQNNIVDPENRYQQIFKIQLLL